jgi:hypothetical protein
MGKMKMPIPTLHSTALPARQLRVCGAWLFIATLIVATASARPKRGKQTPTLLPAPEIDRNASRFILPENQAAYLEKIVARMSMTKRNSDPFGRSQDPDAAPPVVTTPDPARLRITSLPQNVPFQQVVSLLKISTIIPKEKRFIIQGGRSFQVGDTIPLTYRTKPFKAEVVSVTSSHINFRDSQTSETATLEMKMLPPGMRAGTAISEAPGLFRNEKEAPIILDAP